MDDNTVDRDVDRDVKTLARRMSSALLALAKGGSAGDLQPVLEDVHEVTSRLLGMIDEGLVEDFLGWTTVGDATAPDTLPQDWVEGGP